MAERTDYVIDSGLDAFAADQTGKTGDISLEQPGDRIGAADRLPPPKTAPAAVFDPGAALVQPAPAPAVPAITVEGSFADDHLVGGGAAELFIAYLGNDTIDAFDGNDEIHSGMALGGQFEDADTVNAGGGDDLVYAYDDDDYVHTGTGNDWAFGGDGDDTLIGFGGDDVLNGQAGDDTIDAGLDNDWLFGEDGNDDLDGSGGNDIAFGGAGSDSISGGAGNDIAFGEAGNDRIDGRTGNDVLLGGDGADVIDGGEDGDRIAGGAWWDTLRGGDGTDWLYGGHDPWSWGGEGVPPADLFRDLIEGGAGDDVIFGDGGDDTLRGGDGWDAITGGAGADLIEGGRGDDNLLGGTGNDVMRGGGGSDVMLGNGLETFGDPADTFDIFVFGNVGTDPDDDDSLDGGNGGDLLFGGAGLDSLMGGQGTDILAGNGDGDHLWGHTPLSEFSDGDPDIFVRGMTLGASGPVFGGGSGFDYVHDYEGEAGEMVGGNGSFQQGADTHVTWNGATVLVLVGYDSTARPVVLIDPAAIDLDLLAP